MGFRRWRRKMRCLLRYGPRRCPHIERHSRRRRSVAGRAEPPPLPQARVEVDSPPAGRHALPH